jgi:hypothetical protein
MLPQYLMDLFTLLKYIHIYFIIHRLVVKPQREVAILGSLSMLSRNFLQELLVTNYYQIGERKACIAVKRKCKLAVD